eukprot:m.22608 g.22608  ORF g.22608 m.22608 type:complete len:385 (+) comp4005_c0_seq1:22-1176(+)
MCIRACSVQRPTIAGMADACAGAQDGGQKPMPPPNNKKRATAGERVCASCGTKAERRSMKLCGRCQSVSYCNAECQKAHWRSGHKKVCAPPQAAAPAPSTTKNDTKGSADVSEGGNQSLAHPCPICLDKEDDDGLYAMCNSCGQLFCGGCRVAIRTNSTLCPTCREPLELPAAEMVRRLQALLKRPPGRYTAVAQTVLGQKLLMGDGVPRDLKQAMSLLRVAADQGHGDAQHTMGNVYENGQGVRRDYKEAMRWYRLAADNGQSQSMHNIAVLYDNGTGVARDLAKAVRWYRRAGEAGYAPAQFNLGLCYEHGEGVATDKRQAAEWYRRAAEQEDKEAQTNLGRLYFHGHGVEKNKDEATRWLKRAMNNGDPKAMMLLALAESM